MSMKIEEIGPLLQLSLTVSDPGELGAQPVSTPIIYIYRGAAKK